MYDAFKESKLGYLYLWFTKAKYTMGIFFVFFVFLYLLFGFISEGPDVTLDLLTALEMVFACFFIGVAQQAIIPIDKLTKPRSILWVISGIAITLAFSLPFGWFSQFPPWSAVAFNLLVFTGLALMLVSYYLDLHWETKHLNRSLAKFQNKR